MRCLNFTTSSSKIEPNENEHDGRRQRRPVLSRNPKYNQVMYSYLLMISAEGRKANHNNFSSEPHSTNCLVLATSKSSTYKTIFKTRAKVFKYNVPKNIHFSYAHFQIILVQNAANNSEFIELLSFLLIIVKTIMFPVNFMGKMKGRGMPNILLFILYRGNQPLRRQKRFKFYLNKV